MRVAVADGNHGVAAVEIQVLLALVVPEFRAECAHGGDVDERVNVEEIHAMVMSERS